MSVKGSCATGALPQRGGGARVTCKAGNNPLDEILSGSAMSLPTNPRLAAAARAVLAEP